jgi:hypothetical protein
VSPASGDHRRLRGPAGMGQTAYRGSPVPVTGTDDALQLVGLTASALSPGSANLGNVTDATLRACGSGTRRGADPASGGRVCLPPQGSSWVFLAAVSHDTTVWCPWDCSSWSWSSLCSGDVVQLVGASRDGELADRFAPPRRCCAGSLALVDEHVGEPAHAAIIGDPGATHPTISPSRPDRRLSPRMTPPAVARRVGRDPAVCRAGTPATISTPSSRPPPCVAWVEGSRRRGGGPALVLGFARLPEHRIAEAVRLLAEAAATRAGRAH